MFPVPHARASQASPALSPRPQLPQSPPQSTLHALLLFSKPPTVPSQATTSQLPTEMRNTSPTTPPTHQPNSSTRTACCTPPAPTRSWSIRCSTAQAVFNWTMPTPRTTPTSPRSFARLLHRLPSPVRRRTVPMIRSSIGRIMWVMVRFPSFSRRVCRDFILGLFLRRCLCVLPERL